MRRKLGSTKKVPNFVNSYNQMRQMFPTFLLGFLCRWTVICGAFFLTACSTGPKNHDVPPGIEKLAKPGPVLLKLKSVPGRIEQVSYLHSSRSRTYSNDEIQKSFDEILEFTAQAETVKVDEKESLTQKLTTIRKDGTTNLHHFAMPELNETVEVVTTNTGKILRNGKFPKTSIFYVPTISLPDSPVNVGDTWAMQANWIALEEPVPFQLDMVSILKGLHKCGVSQCAEIEISGDVAIAQTALENAQEPVEFKSSWQGKILFNVDFGTVVWSKVKSEEEFKNQGIRREVKSCLEAVLDLPVEAKLAGLVKPSCDQAPVLKK